MTHFITDSAVLHPAINKQFASRESVNHSAKDYARNDVTSNTVESSFAILKLASTARFTRRGSSTCRATPPSSTLSGILAPPCVSTMCSARKHYRRESAASGALTVNLISVSRKRYCQRADRLVSRSSPSAPGVKRVNVNCINSSPGRVSHDIIISAVDAL